MTTPLPNIWIDRTLGASGNSGLGFYKFTFNSGGTARPKIGDILTGDTSTATCIIMNIGHTSGTWAGGNEVGTIYCSVPAVATIANGENMSLSGSQTQANVLTTSSLASVDSLDNITDVTAAKGLGVSKAITGASSANPAVITCTGHGYQDGQYVKIAGVRGNTAVNSDTPWIITYIDANSFSVPVQGLAGYVASTGLAFGCHIVGEIKSGVPIDSGVTGTFTANSKTVTLSALGTSLALTKMLCDCSTTTGWTAPYNFVITSGNATIGATYTNNGQTFTVLATVAAKVYLSCKGTGAPAASGTLTLASGTGDANITFSAAYQATFSLNTTQFKEGSQALKITMPATVPNGTYGYYAIFDLGSDQDCAAFQWLDFWFYNASSGSTNLYYHLRLLDVNYTVLVDAGIRNPIYGQMLLNHYNNGSAMSSAVRYIALEIENVDSSIYGSILSLDNIMVCKNGGLNLTSLISYASNDKIDNDIWFPIQSINGTDIKIDNHINNYGTAGRGFSSPWVLGACTGNGVSPIVITTDLDHHIPATALLTITGFTGNTTANCTTQAITVPASNQISLTGLTGNGTAAAFQAAKINVITTEMWFRDPLRTTAQSTISGTVNACQVLGQNGAYIEYQGGWNGTTLVQEGESLLDGQNGYGRGIDDSGRTFLKFNRYGLVRYYYGLNFTTLNYFLRNINLISCSTSGINDSGKIIIDGYLNMNNNSSANNSYSRVESSNTIQVFGNLAGPNNPMFLNCNLNRIISKNNTGKGIYTLNTSNNYFNNLVTQDNATSGIYALSYNDTNYLNNCLIGEGTEITVSQSGAQNSSVLFSQNHNRITGNDKAYFYLATATKQTTQKPADVSYSWKVSPTNVLRRKDYKVELSLGKFQGKATTDTITCKARIFLDNEAINAGLMVRRKGLADQIVESRNVTDWTDGNALTTLTFTPASGEAFELFFVVWYPDSSTTYTYSAYVAAPLADVNGNYLLVSQ
jgi:hypothetical protein